MRIVFMGTPESALPSLQRLIEDGHHIVAVWTQPDKPAGRHYGLRQSPVKDFAAQHKLTIHQPAKIKTQEAKDLFSSHDAEVAVVVAYGRILPPEFLNAPRRGCVNVHFSLLPKYRGAAPVNWAIVNGEAVTGVTTMGIVEQLDAGPILLQRSSEIRKTDTAQDLMPRLAHLGAGVLSETIAKLNSLTGQPQNDADATFAPILKREDGLIDWRMNALAIERRVRGFQPWPGAFALRGKERLIIWRAEAEKFSGQAATIGQVIEASGDKLQVACGDQSALRILELQQEGKRRLSSREFLNGAKLSAGEILGGHHK